MHELILGGQKSGKSRCAEERAQAWLTAPERQAVLLATAMAGDDEMRARIVRHRLERARRVPRLAVEEEHHDLAAAIQRLSQPSRLVVVDCLTLWLTQRMMPLHGAPREASVIEADRERLLAALKAANGPVVLVSNEIGLGVSPLGRETRHFLDELGRLHQAVARVCERVTLMVAGIELPVKRAPA